MTTRQRLDLLSRTFPRLFPRAELLRLVRDQLGDVDALDRWVSRGQGQVRARAPRLIQHICAGNLAISAITSIAHGLLLGAENAVKLPGDPEDAATRREILDFVRRLPASLRNQVRCETKLNVKVLRRADVVIAFGGDAAMASIRGQLRWDQKFIAHGHAVSLLWLAEPDRLSTRQARACAVDILTYDQLGCLSPQAVYVPPGADLDALGRKLALALEHHWQLQKSKPARTLAINARIVEARDVALALGHRVWLPPGRHFGWTMIHDPDPAFTASPLHGVIYLRKSAPTALPRHLQTVRGRISTVGFIARGGKSSSHWREAFLSLGVSRFCPAGRMQSPPLTWHHDGRGTLADLVTWIDLEEPAR